MLQRIKGTRIQIWSEDEAGNFDDLLREYQDPEGWAITDAGLNEDEQGYHFSVPVKGVGGSRRISFSITRAALTDMLYAVEERFVITDTLGVQWDTIENTAFDHFEADAGCCGGACLCNQSV